MEHSQVNHFYAPSLAQEKHARNLRRFAQIAARLSGIAQAAEEDAVKEAPF